VSSALGVIVATALAGLMFWPVFAPGALVTPLLAVCVPVWLVGLLLRGPRLSFVRVPAGLLLGALVLVETTVRDTTRSGVPTAASARALYRGAVDSWVLTLDSTWPARAEPELLLFVPLLVLLAAVIGSELLAVGPLLALLPGLAVAGLAQAYAAQQGRDAVLAAIAFGCAAGVVIVTWRSGSSPAEDEGDGDPEQGDPGAAPERSESATAAATGLSGGPGATPGGAGGAGPLRRLTALVVVLCALVAGAFALAPVDPMGRQAFSLKDHHEATLLPEVATSPLDEIAQRLQEPGDVVFRDRTEAPVDRWSLVVLDAFDGQNWTPSERYQPLGVRLGADPAVTVPTRSYDAVLKIEDLPGPWLPTQARTETVEGAETMVGVVSGSLASGRSAAGVQYRLRWSAPQVSADLLAGAALGVDPATSSVSDVPAEVSALARQAVGDAGPSLGAALRLETFLRQHYRVATGRTLPTGHGYPQITHFLTAGRRGTSEQFASAYVVMARTLGIPARLAVGFRQPATTDPQGSYVVRNGDVLAWPEVLVADVGWVPLDPTASATGSTRAGDKGLAAATDKTRRSLPQPDNPPPQDEPLPAATDDGAAGGRRDPLSVLPWVAAGIGVLALCWLVLVPFAKRVRTGRRRRRRHAAAVVAAWLEARDRLADHGVRPRPGMTVRDLATASTEIVGENGVRGLRRLGTCVDRALWAGDDELPAGVAGEAWTAVREVRKALRRRPAGTRVRAALSPTTLVRRG